VGWPVLPSPQPRISHQRPSQESPPARQDSRFNSALTSRDDSARPIIFFGTFLAVFASSACASTNSTLAVDLVDDPEQRHHVAERDCTSAPGRAASPISRAKGGCGEHR
jgi:hypothetical protein